jgi:hypothetical protein
MEEFVVETEATDSEVCVVAGQLPLAPLAPFCGHSVSIHLREKAQNAQSVVKIPVRPADKFEFRSSGGIHSPFRRAQGPERAEGLTLAAT